MAYQLTSKDMQLFRAKNFGAIPTFDLSKKDSDNDIKTYCQSQSFICDTIQSMRKIDVKKIFDTRYVPAYIEIELIIPPVLRNFLKTNDMTEVAFSFLNVRELITTSMGIFSVLTYTFIVTLVLCSFGIMYLIIKYRNNPYIKVISPIFCDIIIFGSILKMISLLMLLPPYSVFKCKVSLVYDTMTLFFIYIPMFVVTFRIYRIYRAKTIISKRLTNKNLLIITSVILGGVFIFKVILTFTSDFYYLPFGYIDEGRYPQYYYSGYEVVDKIDEYSLLVIVS